MSIIRVGLSENKEYGSGWDSVFRKGKTPKAKATTAAKKKAKPAKKKKK